MKKSILLLLALALVSATASGQLLWKVTGNGGAKPSYILGTHHFAPISTLDSIPGFRDAFESVDEIYGELDDSEMAKPESSLLTLALMAAPADSTLTKVLTKAQLDSLSTYMTELAGRPIDAAAYDSMNPAAIGMVIMSLTLDKAMPGRSGGSIDSHVQTLARQAGKTIHGLETMTEQLTSLFGDPISVQVRDLMATVAQGDPIPMSRQLYSLYRAGDLGRIHRLMNDPKFSTSTDGNKKLVDDRNHAWADFLIGILPTTAIMIVVGAAHLPGEEGLINLLRKTGFTVSPVTE